VRLARLDRFLDHHQNHGQSLHIARIPGAEARGPAVMVEMADRIPLARVSAVWGGPADNLDLVDIDLLSTADKLLGERVYVGSQDRVYKSPVCNQDILRDVPSDEHRGTHHLQNSIHILRTTNTLAYVSDCIREEIHKHRLSCTSHVANAYRQSRGVLFHEDELAAVSAVGSSEAMVMCAVMDSAGDRGGIQQQ